MKDKTEDDTRLTLKCLHRNNRDDNKHNDFSATFWKYAIVYETLDCLASSSLPSTYDDSIDHDLLLE